MSESNGSPAEGPAGGAQPPAVPRVLTPSRTRFRRYREQAEMYAFMLDRLGVD